MKKNQSYLVLTLFAVLFCFLHADLKSTTLVVKYGPSADYVTGSKPFNRKDGHNNIPFSMSEHLSPVSGYSAPSGMSGVFYGGYEKRINGVLSDTLETDGHGVHNNQLSGNDTIRLRTHPFNVQGDLKVSLLVVFDTDEFLNVDEEEVVSFDENSTFTYWVNGASWGNQLDAALVVREGSNFYRSNLFVPQDQNAMSDPVDIAELDWYYYDPATEIDIVGSGTSANPAFSDITAIGLYMSGSNTNNRALVQLVGLEVHAEVGPLNPEPDPEPLGIFLTAQRMEAIESLFTANDPIAQYYQARLNQYLTTMPYFRAQFSAAYALSYIMFEDEDHLDRAKELLNITYFNDPTVGWPQYQNRNSFRTGGRWPFLVYNWLYPHFTPQERAEMEDYFALWANYWLNYTKHTNNYEGLLVRDTDDITSLVENLTIMGYVMSDSPVYSSLGETLLEVADEMLDLFIVQYYMEDIGLGGMWMEGSDYSPHTQGHWMRTFLMNKELRGIPFPSDYAEQTTLGLIHQTLAGRKTMYQYGSVEQGQDYSELDEDYRAEKAVLLMPLLDDPFYSRMIYHWYEDMADERPMASYATRSGLYELMFMDPNADKNFDLDELETLYYSPGVGFVSSRTDWSDEASNLYVLNRRMRVDQEKFDVLHYELAYQGRWATKGVTTYGGPGAFLFNTILVENADNGWNNPTRRAKGDPFYRTIYDDANLTLLSLEAADVYNMIGFYGTTYAHSVARQIAFIKPNLLMVHDHVETYPDEIKDLIQYKPELNLVNGDSHIREVSQIQHVQAEPVLLDEASNTYRITNPGETEVIWQMAWPENPSITIVDEKVLWAGLPEYSVPQNQRKWHLRSTLNEAQVVTDYVSFILVDLAEAVDPLEGSTPIVDFGPSAGYVSANSVLQISASGGQDGHVPFSLNHVLSPTNMSSPSGLSSTFYGGIEVHQDDELKLAWLNHNHVRDDSPNDYINVETRWGSAQELTTIFVWQSDQFLGDFANNTVSFNEQTVLQYRIGTTRAGYAALVVVDDGDIYHSELIPVPENASAITGLINVSELEWYAYDPYTAIRIDSQNPGTVVYPSLEDVSAIGLYAYGNGGGTKRLHLHEFRVVNLAEPEEEPEFEGMPWELLSEENGGILDGHVFAAAVEGGDSNYLIIFNRDVTVPVDVTIEVKYPDWFTPDYIYCLGWESGLFLEFDTYVDQGETILLVEPFQQQNGQETRVEVNDEKVAAIAL